MIPRPFITVNFAMTLDARISTRKKTPSDFSSPRDKHRLLEIRAECDAVLIGARTLAADTMSGGLPLPALRAARERKKIPPQPLRVAFSNSGKISEKLPFFTAPMPAPVLFSTRRMSARGVSVFSKICDLHLHSTSTVHLPSALAILREDYGIRRAVCEGGGTLMRSLLVADLVDELHVTLCPRIFAGKSAPTLSGISSDYLPKSTPLRLIEMTPIGGECFTRWRVLRRGSTL